MITVSSFKEKLELLGAKVMELPLIRILPSEDKKLITEVFAGIATYEWAVFTSANGAREFLRLFFLAFGDIRSFGPMRIACVGEATAKIFRDHCLEVESQLGRVRTGEWTPRSIDLDIIAYGDEIIEHERLQVPHPRIAERDFVVHPLCAIAPNLEIRDQSVAHLAASLPMERLKLCKLKLEIV